MSQHNAQQRRGRLAGLPLPDTMADPDSTARPTLRRDGATLLLGGDWTLRHVDTIIALTKDTTPGPARTIDASAVVTLDSLGALALLHLARIANIGEDAIRFNDNQAALIEAIREVSDDRPEPPRDYGVLAALDRMGRSVVRNWQQIVTLVAFLGETLAKMVRLVGQPQRIRLTSVVFQMEQVGLDAVPLILLLNFLVGAVIAFLGANVLKDFGATIFVVELVDISFLREFAVLLTAILLAGRTASAFAAQIGAMVSREEVDAMRTLGLDPVDVLVIPRVIALLVMLPLLTFLAMLAGLAGGMAVGAISLDIPMQAWMSRMESTIEVRHFVVGITKAPFFAMIIALIGCLQGLQVEGTAQSVGERTTASVVQSIALVIVLDALAAMWFMYMGF
ncbi:Glycosyl transferase family 2 [Lysobacter silvestris]|uniref:Glycosyl transferase family 2 n=2 Tax=Solilutibacter silvestris TaxID=1645665 RepID=A0A2K1Q2F9_9GAMM|nr:Glycosyl transferase family 2 [Lysobacter silvestris]